MKMCHLSSASLLSPALSLILRSANKCASPSKKFSSAPRALKSIAKTAAFAVPPWKTNSNVPPVFAEKGENATVPASVFLSGSYRIMHKSSSRFEKLNRRICALEGDTTVEASSAALEGAVEEIAGKEGGHNGSSSSEIGQGGREEGIGEEKSEGGAVPKTEIRKRLVSGIQPTGSIHLGNYLGAIKNWIPLQETSDAIFFVVDLHAITLPHDVAELSKSTRNAAAIYLACGVDPQKAPVFVQSHVKAHPEMTWLLSCVTPISWLNKMIQFKEKARKAGEDVGTGLLTYPLLMASDILLYQCDVVPVGEDQRQHLELARDIAARVNNLYGGKKWKKRGGRGGRIFKVPEAMIRPEGARIMSLTDGTAKMSKSAPSDMSRINLLDSKDIIANKIKRCKTDAFVGMEFGNPERPECTNLLSIYQLVSNKTKEEVAEEVREMTWGAFKPILTDALIAHLDPIQKRYAEVVADEGELNRILAQGSEKANEIAERTLRDTYDALGFFPPQRI